MDDDFIESVKELARHFELPRCPVCGFHRETDTHHWDYYNDVTVDICRPCHNYIHNGRGRRVRDNGYTAERLDDYLSLHNPNMQHFDGNRLFRDWRDLAILRAVELVIEHRFGGGVVDEIVDESQQVEYTPEWLDEAVEAILDELNIPERLAPAVRKWIRLLFETGRFDPFPDQDIFYWELMADCGFLTAPD